MDRIVELIEQTVTPGTVIPKPAARGDFVMKRWGRRRGGRALVYTIPNHNHESQPYQKGITESEWVKAYGRLIETGLFTREWFRSTMTDCNAEGSCNFTTIGGVFELLGVVARLRGAALGVWLFTAVAAPTGLAAEQSDIQRAEQKLAIREMARRIVEGAVERATDAVHHTAVGKENNEQQSRRITGCLDGHLNLLRAQTDAVKARTLRPEEADALEGFDDLTDCIEAAKNANPNAEIIADLRDDFIEEELQALRESMDEAALDEVREEVKEWSI